MTIEQKFIDGFKEYYSKSRVNSQFYNRMIAEKKFLRIHPIIIPTSCMDVLVSFSDTNEIVYLAGEDLQREVYNLIENAGWHGFLRTGFSEEELIDFLPETRYIETSRFTKIELSIPTWNDLINSPKIGDANFIIMKETFEEFHGIEDMYESNYDTSEFFNNNENKPEELELRIVFNDIDEDHKYGHATILMFWKGEFLGLCNECINRWNSDYYFYFTDIDKWRELMKVLFNLANIQPTSPIRGAEMLDMTQNVEHIAAVPGFTEKSYE